MFRSTKTFHFLPCAHRQWRDEGHCKFIHGYDRSVQLVFECRELDDKMWVMDFGGLKPIKEWLENLFDNTLLINEDDSERDFFRNGKTWIMSSANNTQCGNGRFSKIYF